VKKLIAPTIMTIVIIISVLGIVLTYNTAKEYINQKNSDISYWSTEALKYQSEAMNLGYKLEDLNDSWVSQYDEIKKLKNAVKRKNEKIEVAPVVSKPLSVVDIIPKIQHGVVHIQCPQWQGSGFVVGPNLIGTARHCVKDVEDFNITTHDGHKLHATRAISSKKHDIAFIYVDDFTCVSEKEQEIECKKVNHKVKLTPLKLGSIKDCKLGQEVITVGSPYGKVNFNSVTKGIISGFDRVYELSDRSGNDYGWNVAFQTDSPGHPGNSGCPIFTADGVVRGILVGRFSPSLIIAMPVDIFLDDIEEIELMFIQDKYEFEKEPEYVNPYYNHADGTEYYNATNGG
jgi:S1-C subfamily serine protease